MPVFTKRHYKIIARVIHENTSGEQNRTLCDAFAATFEKDNPNFDRLKWNRACRMLRQFKGLK